MVVALGDLGVGAGHANGGHASIGEGVGSGDGDAGAIGAQDDGGLLCNQGVGSGHGLVVGGLVVHDLKLDVVGLAVDFHGGLDGVGILHAENFLLAACAVVAGHGLIHADDDGVAGCSGVRVCVCVSAGVAAGTQGESHAAGQQKCENLLHVLTSLNSAEGVRTIRTSVFLQLRLIVYYNFNIFATSFLNF